MKVFPAFLLLAAQAGAANDAATEWGRVRAYFSAGVVFSRDDAAFSRQEPFVAFNLDKNWRTGETLMINTFFETQLTSIAVSTGAAGVVSSQKAASMGAGVYLPVLTTRWTFAKQR